MGMTITEKILAKAAKRSRLKLEKMFGSMLMY